MRDLYKFLLLGATILLTFLFFNKITEHSCWISFNDHNFRWSDRWDEENDEKTPWKNETQTLMIPFDTLSKKAVLNLEAAAGDFTIADTTPEYIQFRKEGDIGNYTMLSEEQAGRKMIRIKLQEEGGPRHSHKNNVEIRLNPKPSWNLNLDIGAAEIDMDLKKFRIDTADIDAGASSIKMTLGDNNPRTVVILNAGASSINLEIPNTAACEIRSESFLISRDFEGFSRKKEGIYQTDNFATAKNKIYVEVKTAVSSIGIKRY